MTASAEADEVSWPLLPLTHVALIPYVFAEHPEVVSPHFGQPGHEVIVAHLVLQLGPVYFKN